MVSTRLAPLRALSYCDVVTLCAFARSPSINTGISMDGHARDLEAFTKLLPPFLPADALCYSSRRAVMGSTRVALCAGTHTAMRATTLRRSGVTTNATGSQA